MITRLTRRLLIRAGNKNYARRSHPRPDGDAAARRRRSDQRRQRPCISYSDRQSTSSPAACPPATSADESYGVTSDAKKSLVAVEQRQQQRRHGSQLLYLNHIDISATRHPTFLHAVTDQCFDFAFCIFPVYYASPATEGVAALSNAAIRPSVLCP